MCLGSVAIQLFLIGERFITLWTDKPSVWLYILYKAFRVIDWCLVGGRCGGAVKVIDVCPDLLKVCLMLSHDLFPSWFECKPWYGGA